MNYYAGLGLAQDARVFVADVRTRLEEELHLLNATLAQNDRLRLRAAGENRISITPFTPQPEPVGLIELKSERGRSWPMTGLLDVLKETALDTQFLEILGYDLTGGQPEGFTGDTFPELWVELVHEVDAERAEFTSGIFRWLGLKINIRSYQYKKDL